jgi:hypothetical protein
MSKMVVKGVTYMCPSKAASIPISKDVLDGITYPHIASAKEMKAKAAKFRAKKATNKGKYKKDDGLSVEDGIPIQAENSSESSESEHEEQATLCADATSDDDGFQYFGY